MPIIEFGTEAQQQQYLGPLAAGELKLTAAISEIAMPAAIQQGVSATKSDNGWTLTGSLDCVQDGAVANFILVPATDASGNSSIFIIDSQAQGVSLQAQEISLLGPWSAALSLSNVAVNADALLGAEGQAPAIIHWLEQYANVGQCAMQTGICEEAMRRTAAYTSEREQFGVPIGSFQALAMRMADSYIDVEAMRSTFWLALWRLDEGLPAEAEIRAAKWWACDGAHRVIHTAQHLHAGIGADVEYPIHRFYLWAKQLSYCLGNGSHQLEQLGKLLAADDSVGYAAIEI
jgi:alkylation response protein AidB-like acyl-CoA dehydrogenase